MGGGRSRNFYKMQSLYSGGGELRIFPSPKAYIGEERGEVIVPKPQENEEIWGKYDEI